MHFTTGSTEEEKLWTKPISVYGRRCSKEIEDSLKRHAADSQATPVH
jgi:hypothetical protein